MVTTTFSLADLQDFAGPGANHHTDPGVAAATGLPGPILQGVQAGPLAVDLLEESCGDLTGRWVRSTYLSHIFSDRPVVFDRVIQGNRATVRIQQGDDTALIVEVAEQPRVLASPQMATKEARKRNASQIRSDLMKVPITHALEGVHFTIAPEWIDRVHRASKADRRAGGIHPGLLMQAYYWLFERRVEQDGLIHAKQDFRWFTRPRAGDELIVTGTVSDRYTKRGRPYVVVAISTRHAETDEPVTESFEHCTWKSVPVSSGGRPTSTSTAWQHPVTDRDPESDSLSPEE